MIFAEEDWHSKPILNIRQIIRSQEHVTSGTTCLGNIHLSCYKMYLQDVKRTMHLYGLTVKEYFTREFPRRFTERSFLRTGSVLCSTA